MTLATKKYPAVADVANIDVMDTFNIDSQRIMQWSNNLRIHTENVIAIDFIASEMMISFTKSMFGIAETKCADIGIGAGSLEVRGDRLFLRATKTLNDGEYALDILIRKVVHFKLKFVAGRAIDPAHQYGHEHKHRCVEFYCSVNSKYRLARISEL